MHNNIADIRINYSKKSLDESDASKNAFEMFEAWWNEAVHSEITEINAMTLATVKDGMPDARIVLLKAFDERGFVFFTNYNSVKGKELEDNPHATLVFFWKELERQVRINGIGKCQVVAYASYGGYLGVMAWPYSPPQWWVEHNGTPGPDNAGLVFGAEISAKEA